MIQISTRGRYAVRAMLDLAENDSAQVSRQDLARRQQISPDYVAQILRHLRMAGIVRSSKGPGGGYSLARDPGSITIGEILRVTEGPLAAVECVHDGDVPACERKERCAAHVIWTRLSDVIAKFLDSVTLADLREQAECLQTTREEAR